jgi:hypothetical protein
MAVAFWEFRDLPEPIRVTAIASFTHYKLFMYLTTLYTIVDCAQILANSCARSITMHLRLSKLSKLNGASIARRQQRHL